MSKSHAVIVLLVALTALPVLLMKGSASAAEAQTPLSVTVRFSDADLNSAKGVADLYGRIESAATEVCRPAEALPAASRLYSTGWNECFYHAIAQAVRAVHNPKLRAYHWRRVRDWDSGPHPAPMIVARARSDSWP